MAEPGFEPTVSSMVILPGSSARGSESSGAPGSVMSTAWPDLSMSSLCDSCGGLALVGASSLRLRQSLPRCPPAALRHHCFHTSPHCKAGGRASDFQRGISCWGLVLRRKSIGHLPAFWGAPGKMTTSGWTASSDPHLSLSRSSKT